MRRLLGLKKAKPSPKPRPLTVTAARPEWKRRIVGLEKTGQLQKALKLAREWSIASPQDEWAWLLIARICRRLENYEEELRAIEGREQARRSAPLGTTLVEAPIIFVHLPKTGGISIGKGDIDGVRSIGHRLVSSDGCEHYTPSYSTHFPSAVPVKGTIATNVRNIFAFLRSLYFETLPGRKNLANQPDVGAAEKGFDYFVRFLSEREGIWPGRGMLFCQVFDFPAGNWAVDWVNRLETIQDDMAALLTSVGANAASIGRANTSPFHQAREDYRSAFSDELAELVLSTWSRDVELFGFGFDTPYRHGIGVHRQNVPRELTYRFPWSLASPAPCDA